MMIYFALVLLLLTCRRCEGYPTDTVQKQALVDFFNAFNGSGWVTTWDVLGPADPSTWYGVTCIDDVTMPQSNVVNITLPYNNLFLVYTWPASFANLAYLIELNLNGNAIKWFSLVSIPSLKVLNMIDAGLTYLYPGLMCYSHPSLEELRLSHNRFAMDFPYSSFCISSALRIFEMESTQMSGVFPSAQFLSLPSIVSVIVHNNSFSSDTVPSQISSSLEVFEYHSNSHIITTSCMLPLFLDSASYSIPQAPRIRHIALSNHYSPAVLMPSLVNIPSTLEHISCRGCNFIGSPIDFNELIDPNTTATRVPLLRELDISRNSFGAGALIPADFLQVFPVMEYFDVSQAVPFHDQNGYPYIARGFFPINWPVATLKYLDLSGNCFDDHRIFPYHLLTNLEYLKLSDTCLVNSLTHHTFNDTAAVAGALLPNLKEIDLSFNLFTGLVTNEFLQLVQAASVIDISNNFLDGTLPDFIGSLPVSTNLIIDNNLFAKSDITGMLANNSMLPYDANIGPNGGVHPHVIGCYFPKLECPLEPWIECQTNLPITCIDCQAQTRMVCSCPGNNYSTSPNLTCTNTCPSGTEKYIHLSHIPSFPQHPAPLPMNSSNEMYMLRNYSNYIDASYQTNVALICMPSICTFGTYNDVNVTFNYPGCEGSPRGVVPCRPCTGFFPRPYPLIGGASCQRCDYGHKFNISVLNDTVAQIQPSQYYFSPAYCIVCLPNETNVDPADNCFASACKGDGQYVPAVCQPLSPLYNNNLCGTTCLTCPANSVSSANLTQSLYCTGCAFGSAVPQNQPRGSCIPCAPGNYPKALPDLNATEIGVVGLSQEKEWVKTSECVRCPVGGICSGGVNLPLAQPGYWISQGDYDSGNYNFLLCPQKEQCGGGGPENCTALNHGNGTANENGNNGTRTMRTGVMCADCIKGYYPFRQSCVPCPGPGVLQLQMLFFLVMFVMFYVIFFKFGGSGDKIVIIPMFISFVQLNGIMLNFNLNWDPHLRRLLEFFSFFNLDIQATAPECQFSGITYEQKFIFAMLLPGIMFSFLLVVTILLKGFEIVFVCFGSFTKKPAGAGGTDGMGVSKEDQSRLTKIYSKITSGTILFANIIYMVTVTKAISIFNCTRQANGSLTLDAYPAISCYSQRHLQMIPVAVLVIIFYGLGYPFFIFKKLRHGKSMNLFSDKQFRVKYGSLFTKYRLECYLHELAEITKRLMFVAPTLFFSSSAPLACALGSGLVLVVHGCRSLRYKPYRLTILNRIDVLFTVVTILSLLAGILSTFRPSPESAGYGRFVIAVLIAVFIAVVPLGVMEYKNYKREAKKIDDEDKRQMEMATLAVAASPTDHHDRDAAVKGNGQYDATPYYNSLGGALQVTTSGSK